MRWITVLSLLLVCFVCLGVTHASIEDCCLKHVSSLSINVRRHVVRYTRQNVDGGCNLPAIIFITKRKRVFCTDPASDWVKKLMKRVNMRAHRSKFGGKPYKG